MPDWLRPIAQANPVTIVVNAARGLILGTADAGTVLLALGWIAGSWSLSPACHLDLSPEGVGAPARPGVRSPAVRLAREVRLAFWRSDWASEPTRRANLYSLGAGNRRLRLRAPPAPAPRWAAGRQSPSAPE